MRQYGETSIGRMGLAKKMSAHHPARKCSNKVICIDCGVESWVSEKALQLYPINGKYCFECRAKHRAADKKEMQQALINLARRKGLIK